jgi:hypothetical protein
MGMAAADIMDAVEEAPKGVAVHAIIEEICDDSVVAAGARRSRKSAVVCSASFDDSVAGAVDGPLDSYSEWSDTRTWDLFDAVRGDGDCPFILDLLIEYFV